jgi:hypothetical protein
LTSIGGIDSQGNLLEYRDEEVAVGARHAPQCPVQAAVG